MLTGRGALAKIEQAIGGARADESRLETALNSATAEAARLRHQEADGFRALARVRLDQMSRESTIGELDQVERRALEMIEGYRRQIEELGRKRDDLQAALDNAEAAKHERDQDLADALDTVEELSDRTAERLETDSAWQEAKRTLEAAEAVAKNADEKASLAEADLAAKRQPYEADPLFMYLWNKKHGRAEDKSGSLVKFFDRKVARLIRYHDARPNFAMLQEIPLRLREHAEKKQAEVTAAQERLDGIARRALVADGIEALEGKLAAAQAAAEAAGETVLKITAEIDDVEARRQKAMDADEDVAFDKAAALLSDGLSRESIRELYRDAISTAGAADDEAVASITAARQALEKVDAEVAQIRTEIRELARRRTELEEARNRARRQGYDNPRGSFGDAGGRILGEVLGQVLSGAARGAVLDGIFRDNYRAPPRRSSGSIFGGLPKSSRPDPWGSGSRGTWGRGGGGSKGGKSGGWRTGGKF